MGTGILQRDLQAELGVSSRSIEEASENDRFQILHFVIGEFHKDFEHLSFLFCTVEHDGGR